MKERYYMIENTTKGTVKFRKTEEGKDRAVKAIEAKGHKVKVSIKYM